MLPPSIIDSFFELLVQDHQGIIGTMHVLDISGADVTSHLTIFIISISAINCHCISAG